MECINVLKRSQRSLMSIICSSTQRWFSVNNEHLLTIAKCSIALSRLGAVLSKIPKYLKVYTHSIMSSLNTNSWHGSAKLNTMTFIFFMFIVNPRSVQNSWNVFNYCCSPNSNSNVRTRSSAKSNNHTCMFAKAGALHSLPYKCPSKTSKYNPNSRGLRGQPCFTPC
jgi:hypothetical protein